MSFQTCMTLFSIVEHMKKYYSNSSVFEPYYSKGYTILYIL